MKRCDWAEHSEKEKQYHDTVWGVPVYEDRELFRKLVLDMNQAGLSWATILNKEENFDQAFDAFDIQTVANYDNTKIEELMKNAGIIRNRRKIEAAINNAQIVLALQKEWGSFSAYIWHFTSGKRIINQHETRADVPATSDLSDRVSKDMKKQGFKFIGSTVVYAYLQAIGIINDHLVDCFRYEELI